MKTISLLFSLILIVFCNLSALAQTGNISGRITDKEGFSMPGASILIVETPTKGTISDANGRFSIVNVTPGSYTLRPLCG